MYFDDNKLILLEIIIQLIYKIGGLFERRQSLKNIKYSMKCERYFYIKRLHKGQEERSSQNVFML